MTTTTNNKQLSYLGKDFNLDNFQEVGAVYKLPLGDGDYETDFYFSTCEIEAEIKANADVYHSLIVMSHKGGNCNHCNKKISYMVIAKDIVNETFHVFGRDCGENITTLKAGLLKFLDNAVEKNMLARKRMKNDSLRNEFLDNNEGLEDALYKGTNKILVEMKQKFVTYHSLSEKQISFALSLYKKELEYAKINEVRNNTIPHIIEGRIKNVKMVVSSVKEINFFDDYARENVTKLQLLLIDAQDRKYFGKVNLTDFPINNGQTITISATIKKSPNDNTFGFISRIIIHN